MKYTFPAGFDLNRALELAKLVDAAYEQLNLGGSWQPPDGYEVATELSAKEIWKAPGRLDGLVNDLLKPVPFGFVATKGSDVFVVIRGTRTPLEWLDDFTAKPVPFAPNGNPWGRTTQGFNALFENLGPQVDDALAKLQTGGNSLATIFVTGHGLGAALAHLAAASIAARFGLKPVTYTFCGPRAGDPQFAAAFNQASLQTWRIFNTEDIVPTVPPAAVEMAEKNTGTGLAQWLIKFVQLSAAGYQHVGYPIAVTFHGDSIADNHNLDALAAEFSSA
jgi:triacylglycerol lipase